MNIEVASKVETESRFSLLRNRGATILDRFSSRTSLAPRLPAARDAVSRFRAKAHHDLHHSHIRAEIYALERLTVPLLIVYQPA